MIKNRNVTLIFLDEKNHNISIYVFVCYLNMSKENVWSNNIIIPLKEKKTNITILVASCLSP